MTWRHLAVGAALTTALTTPVLTQNLAADLQRAEQREATSGDCKSTLPEYMRIAEQSAKTGRATAAEALLRAGMCHEQLRDGQARASYAQVTAQFADQREIAAIARQRLAELAAATASAPSQTGRLPDSKSSGPFRALDADTRASIESVLSPDGLRVVEQDARGLVVRELASGALHIAFPTRPAATAELTYRVATPVWSPDGGHIAFFAQDLRVTSDIGNALPQANALRVVSINGADGHEVCKLPAGPPIVSVLEWTARGEILYRVGPRVGARGAGAGGLTPGAGAEFWLVPAIGGEARKSFSMGSERAADVGNTTPDGRQIIAVNSEKLVAVDLATGGARELSLGIGAAYPRVSPDGKLVAYLSRQDGSWAVYVSPLDGPFIRSTIRIADVPARRESPPSLGFAQGMRWRRDGTLTLEYQDSESNLYRVDLDATTGQSVAPPQRLTRDMDAMEPAISPDGKHVLFVLPVSRQSPRSAVFVMPADGGKPRQLIQLPPAQQVSRQIGGTFGWLNNEKVFVTGLGAAIQSVNVTTGEVAPVPNSSPLGKSVLFAQSATDVGRVEVAQASKRIGRRFQYIPARHSVLYEALDQYGGPDLVLRDLATGQDRIVWKNESGVPAGPGAWQVSPDGRLLAYWGVPLGTTFDADSLPAVRDMPTALNIVGLDGGASRIHLRTAGPSGSQLEWAADSRHVRYKFGSSVHVLDVETGASRRLFDELLGRSLGIADNFFGRSAWSPDDRFLIFDATGQATYRFAWQGVTYDIVKKLVSKGGRAQTLRDERGR